LRQQAAQFRDYGLIAFADLRDHHVELVDARRDQACVGDHGVDSADAYAQILGTGERQRGRHQGGSRYGGLGAAKARAK